MSQEITKIKSRIKSVSGALKVTNAMKLVSTVKLKKWKGKMIGNRTYAEEIDDVTSMFLSHAKKYNSPLSIENTATKNLYIIITSTLGLCGSYNSNILKFADSIIKDEDDLLVFGGKGIIHYQSFKNKKIENVPEYSSLSEEKLVKYLNEFMSKAYLNNEYHEVHIIYSMYKNSLIFVPNDYRILPLAKPESSEDDYFSFAPIFEPNEKELFDTLIPIYLKTSIHSKLLEAEVCEQAARSNAMENATDNANEILDDLNIQFNKARQGAITQEIIEVVGAAERV